SIVALGHPRQSNWGLCMAKPFITKCHPLLHQALQVKAIKPLITVFIHGIQTFYELLIIPLEVTKIPFSGVLFPHHCAPPGEASTDGGQQTHY
ncbi:MAG: hypothetical protein AAFW84_21380, partial [Cyanobacteria bacterium J06635_15]